MTQANDAAKAYIATYSGNQFFLLEPRQEDINIFDIAHALALQCRWTGHCKFHYSVAQHSWYCSFIGPQEEAFDRLMHDASEAYMADMSRPLKHFTEAGSVYLKQEAVVQHAIAQRFGFSKVEPPSVKIADNQMLYAERAQIMNYTFDEAQAWIADKDRNDFGVKIESWSPALAEQKFLSRFFDLKPKESK